jgi:hypothetical protein
MENSIKALHKLKMEELYGPTVPLLSIQRNVSQHTIETPAHLCLWQCCSIEAMELTYVLNTLGVDKENVSHTHIYTHGSITQP